MRPQKKDKKLHDILILILEKVKSNALSPEEGVVLIEKLYEKASSSSQSCGQSQGERFYYHSPLGDQAKEILLQILNADDKTNWNDLAEKINQTLKQTLNDWLNKE